MLCLLLIGPVSSWAQTRELDSLKNFVETHPEENEDLSNALARLSYLHNSFDPNEGLVLGTRALKVSNAIDYDEGRSRSHNSIGVNYYALSQYDKAIAEYEEAVFYKEKLGDERGAMITRVNIGVIYAEIRQYNKALVSYEEAYEYFAIEGEEQFMGAVLVNMGIVYRRINANSEALRVYLLAVEQAERSGSAGSMASALTNLGSIYADLNDFTQARLMRKRALAIADSTNNKRLVSRLYNSIGATARSRGDLDSAEYFHKKALALAEEIGVRSTEAVSLQNLGLVEKVRKNYSRAESYYNQALNLRKQGRTVSALATIHHNLGDLALIRRERQVALTHYKESLRIGEEIGSLSAIARATEDLAKFYEKQNPRLAYDYIKRNRTINDSIDDRTDLRELSKLATRYQAEKEKQSILLKQAEEEARLQQQLNEAQITRNIIFFISVIAVISALLYYRFYRLKTRANEKLEEQNSIISEQKEAISLQADKLQLVNSQLEMLSEFRTGLTHMIAHDMKNPLNAIIGLSDRQPSERNVKKIAESGYQMLNLVTNMLEVEKLEEAKIEPKLKEVFIDAVVQKAKQQVEILLQARSIFFQSIVPKQICVMADEEILTRVFVNLFTNAIKYSENGGQVRVKHEVLAEGRIRVAVQDNGPGIDPEKLPHVFDKFWQSDRKKSGLAASTGLGLTFCKLAIESHDGKIWVESVPGEGSTFIFELPLSQEAYQQYSGLSAEAEEENITIIDQAERLLLESYTSTLKDLKVHEVSAINKVLRAMDDQNVVSRWKIDLQAAVYDGDQEKYDQLIEML